MFTGSNYRSVILFPVAYKIMMNILLTTKLDSEAQVVHALFVTFKAPCDSVDSLLKMTELEIGEIDK